MKKVLALVVTAAFVLGMYLPASAADWDLYGQARYSTYWTDYSEERGDRTELRHHLRGNARIGAFVDHGIIGGRFEYGTGVNLRHLYGTVEMGQGELLIGQSETPFGGAGTFISNRRYNADEGLLPTTGYFSRNSMVQYSVDNFKIAAVNPQTADIYDSAQDDFVAIDPEILIPQLQASYDMSMQDMSLHFAGVFQTYDLDAGDGETLTSWGLATSAKLHQMDPVYANLGAFFGQNLANAGLATFGRYEARTAYDAADDSIEDTTTFGVSAALGTTLANDIGLEAGVGYANNDNDMADEDSEFMVIYGNSTIPLTADGNAHIVPEIGYMDFFDDLAGNDAGEEIYAGLTWQVNF